MFEVIAFALVFTFLGIGGLISGTYEVAIVCAILGSVVVGAYFKQWWERRAG